MNTWNRSVDDTVLAAFERAVTRAPDKPFLDFQGVVHTYADVAAKVELLARGLQQNGLGRGDVLCVMLDNNLDSLVSWLAANRLGAIWAAINTALKGEFLRHVVSDTKARIVILEHEFLPRFRDVEDGLPHVGVMYLRPGEVASDGAEGRVPTQPLATLYVDGPPLDLPAVDPADPACIVYTGGTTGPSKGCLLSHRYLCFHAGQRLLASGRTGDEVAWSALPFYHLNVTAGTLLASMLIAGTASIYPRFSLSHFWDDVERSGARVVDLLGAMISLVAQMPDTPAMLRCRGQIRAMMGVPVTPELRETWHKRFGAEIVGLYMYGQTEASPVTNVPAGQYAKPGTAGKCIPEYDVRIFDEHDNELPVGEVGQIVWRPQRPGLMYDGYWGRPDATLAQQRNLWHHTSDLGRFDEEGWLYFVDRKSDYLRRRGENISSQELEAAYLQHPLISQVAVHALPSELGEDDVKVTAVLEDGASLRHEELFEWASSRIPYFALPRYIEFRDELPTSAVGRALKYILRDQGCTPATWDREAAGVTFEKR
jgi:crotonobetaine/carnitine-CoA ligase